MAVKFVYADAQLAAAGATIYTAPTTVKSVIIEAVTVSNTTALDQTHNVHLVSSGGSAIDANKFIDSKAVTANDQLTDSEIVGQVLQAGDFIFSDASLDASLSFRVSLREIS